MNKPVLFYVLLATAVFGLIGCNGSPTNSNVNSGNSNVKTTNSANNAMNSNANANHSNTNMNSTAGAKSANDFMTEAAQGGMAEVELGKLAAKNGQSADVKKFGQKMVDDHSKANDELKQLAAKKNVTLPTDVGAAHKATMDKLSKLTGAEFDKEYVNEMLEDHEKDVKEFQTQADSASDADVKAFAAKTLPTLKAHLDLIKGIHDKMK